MIKMKNILFSISLVLVFFSSLDAQKTINSYEYWFDNDFANKVTTTVTPTSQLQLSNSISTTMLSDGIHTFNFRALDNDGLVSSVLSEYFYRVPAQLTSANKEITAYEYWFDNDFSGAVTVPIISQQQVNVSELLASTGLNNGVHTFNIRFKDNSGMWSSVLSEYFYKVPATITTGIKEIIEVEYWFDNDFQNAQTIATVAQPQILLNDLISTANLNTGVHTFNIRFKDNAGMWSSVLSEYFYKVPASLTTGNKEIIDVEYWFDNDFQNVQNISVSAQQQIILNDLLPTSAINNGIHTFNIRFKDNSNLWSSVLSHYFYKVPQQQIIDNYIVGYRYWLDEDFQDAIYNTVNPPVQQLELIDALDFTMIPKDEYTIHFQFKDTLGMWSSIISDTIVKTPLPIPIFAADSSAFCDQGTVTFINNSVDGDEYLWDFGDGNTSTDETPTHTYLQPGEYNVSLTVYDLMTPIDSTVIETELVIVYETPDNALTLLGNDSICENETVELAANGLGDYNWSTGENTSSILIDDGGDFWVTIVNSDFAACSTNSDTITITIMPLPYADFSYSNDSLEVSFVNLSENGDNYFWDFGDGNTSQDFDPIHNYAQSDNYNVYLITTNWCGSDTVETTVELAFLSLTNYTKENFNVRLFPNPTSKDATIRLSEKQESITLKVYNSIGALMEIKNHYNTNTIHLDFDYPKGTYFIHLFADDFEGVLRLVKQ
jgi:PKD repeat protein